MRLSRRSRRNVAAFAKLQYSPTRAKYLVSQKTRTDELVKVYNEVKK